MTVDIGVSPLHIRAGESKELHIKARQPGTAVIMVEDNVDQRIVVDVANNVTATMIIITDAPGKNVTLLCEGTVAQQGSLLWQIATINAANVQHFFTSVAKGTHATSAVEWLCIARNDAQWRMDVRNVFCAPHGRGDVMMRGIAQDRARIICKGMIDIQSGGTGTETYLTQAMLMLDATAKIDAVPALEIHTDSVRASHSASVSRLSPEDLFYLTSRGLPEIEARRLYIEGFVGDLAGRISDADVRERVNHTFQSLSSLA